MELSEFNSYVINAKNKNPIWFELEHDDPPSLSEIESTQQTLGIEFCPKYIEFLYEYGGGYFAFAEVYSLDANSEFYIAKYNSRESIVEFGYVVLSDNGAGDLYIFSVSEGKASSEVYLLEHESGSCNLIYEDILEFCKSVGLRA